MEKELDGFIIVSKEAADDELSVNSEHSSIQIVEDPAADPVLLGGSDSDEEIVAQEVAATESTASVSGTSNAESRGEDVPEKVEPEPVKKELPKERPKYVCQSCSVDIAATADKVWEGYMGANVPAFLFGKVTNLEPAAEPRQQQLSTGLFLVQDMRCKKCSSPFGWSYLKAWAQDQKYKEGATIIQQSLLLKLEE